MIRIRTASLFGVMLVLASVLATAAYFRAATPAPRVFPLSIPNANPVVVENVDLPLAAAKPALSTSVYLDEQTLKTRIEQAFDHGNVTEARSLLGVLNKRYEHRCCGLPR